MNITISPEGCQKNDIDIGEVILLFAIINKVNIKEAEESLVKKGFITANINSLFQTTGEWRVTTKGISILDSVILDSEKGDRSDNELLELAGKLKAVFPIGKKEGTSNYWAEGKALIAKRLKAFFKKYGNNYSDEAIIEATRKYVEGFNGDYQYMRTLKYFIFKDKETLGEREYTSDLLNYLENAGNEETLRNDWNTTLR